MVLCLIWLINVSFPQLLGRGRSCHPGHYICVFMTWKRGTRPLCSLQQESWKTFLDGGQVWMQVAGDLSVSFYANFLFFTCVIHYFGLQVHAARLILSRVFVASPVLICVDIVVPCLLWGDKRLMLPSPHHIITFNFVVPFWGIYC